MGTKDKKWKAILIKCVHYLLKRYGNGNGFSVGITFNISIYSLKIQLHSKFNFFKVLKGQDNSRPTYSIFYGVNYGTGVFDDVSMYKSNSSFINLEHPNIYNIKTLNDWSLLPRQFNESNIIARMQPQFNVNISKYFNIFNKSF